MRLSKLRGAIRSSKGNPSIIVELTPGHSMTLPLQKTPLLAELGRVYADADDTGLTFDPESGVLRSLTPMGAAINAMRDAGMPEEEIDGLLSASIAEAVTNGAFDEDDEDML